jgi:hypothetical protein
VRRAQNHLMTNDSWASDVIVDLLHAYDLPYAAMNPGASFRGLHDSIVNYGGNHLPEVIECAHEEVSVAIAHGYAKATGRPMVAIAHNIVGLQHASMAIFNAWCDRLRQMGRPTPHPRRRARIPAARLSDRGDRAAGAGLRLL